MKRSSLSSSACVFTPFPPTTNATAQLRQIFAHGIICTMFVYIQLFLHSNKNKYFFKGKTSLFCSYLSRFWTFRFFVILSNPQATEENNFCMNLNTKKFGNKSDFRTFFLSLLFSQQKENFLFFPVCMHHEEGRDRNNKTIKQLKLYNFCTGTELVNVTQFHSFQEFFLPFEELKNYFFCDLFLALKKGRKKSFVFEYRERETNVWL